MFPKDKWFSSKVSRGHEVGKAIGYPTINLNPRTLPKDTQLGVYASLIKLENYGKKNDSNQAITLVGALYLGPRQVFNETKTVLEIHLLDFDGNLYDKTVQFCLTKFIRGITTLDSIEALKQQLTRDINAVRQSLNYRKLESF